MKKVLFACFLISFFMLLKHSNAITSEQKHFIKSRSITHYYSSLQKISHTPESFHLKLMKA